jgi:hypothetical protein
VLASLSVYKGDIFEIDTGGHTAYDIDPNMLGTIFDLWTGTGDYSYRISSIRAQYFQTVTVFDDGVRDILRGYKGTDWFFADVDGQDGDDDWIKDRTDPEIVDFF